MRSRDWVAATGSDMPYQVVEVPNFEELLDATMADALDTAGWSSMAVGWSLDEIWSILRPWEHVSKEGQGLQFHDHDGVWTVLCIFFCVFIGFV